MTKKYADPNKFFIKNLPAFFAYVNSRHILPMILLIAGGFIFTLLPSVIGLLAMIILYALAFKFAVDVLIETANGNMQPGDFQSSFEAKDILIKFILIGLIQGGLFIWVKLLNDPLLLIAFLIFSTFITPAIFMVLSLTNSVLNALNPVTLIRLIKPWLFTYLIFVGFWLLLEVVQTYAIEPLSLKIPGVFGMIFANFFKIFFLILNFHIMGFLIFQNRKAFNFETEFDTEKNQSDNVNFDQSPVNPIYERIRNLLATGELTQAQAIITDIRNDGDDSQELRDLATLAFQVNHGEEIKPLTDAEKIHQLITDKKIGEAFEIYNQLMLDQKKYIEQEAQDVSALAQYAFDSQKFQMVINILKFFHNKYPKHEDIVSNYFLIVEILYKNDKTKDKAKTMLAKLIKGNPHHKLIPKLSSWLKGIELMERK